MTISSWVRSFIAVSKTIIDTILATTKWLGDIFVQAMRDLVPYTMIFGFALAALDVLALGGVGFIGLAFYYAGLCTLLSPAAFTMGATITAIFMRNARYVSVRVFK